MAELLLSIELKYIVQFYFIFNSLDVSNFLNQVWSVQGTVLSPFLLYKETIRKNDDSKMLY